MSRPITPEVGTVEPWRLLGYLESRLDYVQTIDVEEWNAAVLACSTPAGEAYPEA